MLSCACGSFAAAVATLSQRWRRPIRPSFDFEHLA
jgi:hypothetical protein